MSILSLIPQLSLDNFTALALIISTPWIYKVYRPFSDTPPTSTPLARLISMGLLLHTLVMMYNIFVSPPLNIFKALGVHESAPPDLLRAKLKDVLGEGVDMGRDMEVLLKRLGFGHDVVASCSYCHSFEDFALYAFPGPLVQYIREIAFVGLLTLPKSASEHFRPLGLGALLAALLTEFYWTLTVPAPIATHEGMSTVMWHDTFVTLRSLLFLLLPLLISILPSLHLHTLPLIGPLLPGPAPSPYAHLHPNINPAMASNTPQFKLQGQDNMIPTKTTLGEVTAMSMKVLGHLVPTLQLVKYTHAAVMRDQRGEGEYGQKRAGEDGGAHEKASSWWGAEKREGQVIRSNETIKKMFEAGGMGYEGAQVDENGGAEGQEQAKVVKEEGKLL
ncbi:hypothetical protein CVT24_012469, partial [Panaeolus cyanescens]